MSDQELANIIADFRDHDEQLRAVTESAERLESAARDAVQAKDAVDQAREEAMGHRDALAATRDELVAIVEASRAAAAGIDRLATDARGMLQGVRTTLERVQVLEVEAARRHRLLTVLMSLTLIAAIAATVLSLST